MKRTEADAAGNIFRFVAGAVLFLSAFFIGHTDEDVPQTVPEKYRGMIRLYDHATTTVLGNDYSVISTICEEFSAENEMIYVRAEKIRGGENGGGYLQAVENADIIRRDKDLDDGRIMESGYLSDMIRKNIPSEDYEISGQKAVVPLWYDVAVMIVNPDICGSGADEITMENIGELCGKLSEGGYTACCGDERIYSVISSTDSPSYFPASGMVVTGSGGINEFFSGKCGIFLGTLKDVAYLIRQEKRGMEVCEYDIGLIPCDEDIMYITRVGEYAALECDDPEKAEAVIAFMEHLLSYEAARYTENLGYLPFVHAESIGYEKYPHLREFADFSGRKVYIDSLM